MQRSRQDDRAGRGRLTVCEVPHSDGVVHSSCAHAAEPNPCFRGAGSLSDAFLYAFRSSCWLAVDATPRRVIRRTRVLVLAKMTSTSEVRLSATRLRAATGLATAIPAPRMHRLHGCSIVRRCCLPHFRGHSIAARAWCTVHVRQTFDRRSAGRLAGPHIWHRRSPRKTPDRGA